MATFRQRRGTAAALAAANETPAAGQIYFEIDTFRIKIGNGSTAYNSLPYIGGSLSTIAGLQEALDAKAALTHTHVIANVTGLQSALDGKAASSHNHSIANVTGLQAAIDAKADLSHIHVIANVTGLQAALDGRALATHTHSISGVTGLQDALDAKQAAGSYAATVHTHSASDITSGTLSASLLPASGVAAGTYTSVTVDSSGRVTAATNPPGYSLPAATASTLGGVKVGSGVSVSGDGTISVAPGSIAIASATVLGGVKIGSGVSIAGDGTISVAGAVSSVAGKTGVVTLVKSDVGLGNVDNTSDADKPISTATQAALNAKANATSVLVDASGVTTIYVGRAASGTLSSSAGWTIKRSTFSSLGELQGTTTATGIWNNRTTLIYS